MSGSNPPQQQDSPGFAKRYLDKATEKVPGFARRILEEAAKEAPQGKPLEPEIQVTSPESCFDKTKKHLDDATTHLGKQQLSEALIEMNKAINLQLAAVSKFLHGPNHHIPILNLVAIEKNLHRLKELPEQHEMALTIAKDLIDISHEQNKMTASYATSPTYSVKPDKMEALKNKINSVEKTLSPLNPDIPRPRKDTQDSYLKTVLEKGNKQISEMQR